MSTEQLFDPGPEVDIDELVLSQLVGEIRPLEERDLRLLKLHGPDSSGQSVVEKLRAAHHQIARLVVQGWTYIQIAEETGYSAVHIGNLCNNSSAFRELVDHYQAQMTDAMISHHSKIHFAAGLAVELVTEEMMEKAESLTPDFKLRAMRELLSFAGYNPVSRNENLNVNAGITRAELSQIKADTVEARSVQPIPTKALPAQSPGPNEGNSPVAESSSPERPAIPAGCQQEDRGSPVGGGVDGKPAPQYPLQFPVG